MAVVAEKMSFFAAAIASAQSRSAELFRVVKGLLHHGPQEDSVDYFRDLFCPLGYLTST